MNIFDLIICHDIAASLQTLAEKMSNTIYRAAKVCSYHISVADKLLIYHGKIYSLFRPSVYLMYEMNLIQHALTYMTMCNLYIKRVYILYVLLYNTI